MAPSPSSSGTPMPVKPRPEEEKLLTQCRALLVGIAPYMATSVFTFPVLAVPGANCHYTDSQGRLYIDFDTVDEMDLPGLLMVGMWRLLREHPQRRDHYGADEAVWDLASFATVVPDVHGQRTHSVRCLTVPNPITTDDLDIHPPSGGSLSVEDVYAELMGRISGNSPVKKPGQGDDGNSGEGGQGGNGQDGDSDDEGQSGGSGEGQGDDGQDAAGQGQNAGDPYNKLSTAGLPQPQYRTADENQEGAADKHAQGLSTDKIKGVSYETAKDAAHHKAIGNALPDHVDEWSTERLKKPVLTPHMLGRSGINSEFDRSRSGSVRTFGRRSRRGAGLRGSNIILKGSAREVVHVYFALDVSGSMSELELEHGFSEIAAMAQSKAIKVHYFSVSTMPHPMRELETGEKPVIDRDQAGTDMRMAFERFDVEGAKVRVLITDAETPWPKSFQGGTQNIIVITSPDQQTFNRRKASIPEGAEVIWLPLDEDTDWDY